MAEFGLAVTEGQLEEPVVRKTLASLRVPSVTLRVIVKGGRHAFWRDISRYNMAAASSRPILGLADLESYPCPSGLILKHLPQGQHKNLVLRLAETMLESWLLADIEAMAGFLRVSVRALPRYPEQERNPKQTLVNLARRSRIAHIRADLVPLEGSKGIVGRGYVSRMTEFVVNHWRPVAAVDRSESLRRAMSAIRSIAEA